MKSLYKKLSVGVLSAALVAGGSLSQGAIAHAEVSKCKYSIDKYVGISSNQQLKSLKKAKDNRDFNDMLKYQKEFNYEVGPVIVDGASQKEANVAIFAEPIYFFSALVDDRDSLKALNKCENKDYPYVFAIGSDSYMINIK